MEKNIEVRNLLLELRIFPNKKGYAYLIEAVAIWKEQTSKGRMSNSTMNIYKEVAQMFQVTQSSVERCIRHAIQAATLNPTEKMQALFPYLIGIPTNSAFISVLAEHLALQSEERSNR